MVITLLEQNVICFLSNSVMFGVFHRFSYRNGNKESLRLVNDITYQPKCLWVLEGHGKNIGKVLVKS